MLLLSALLWIVGSYFFTGICMYLYAVAKTYEILNIWTFKIHEERIGVCAYPKWLMGWMYSITNKKG